MSYTKLYWMINIWIQEGNYQKVLILGLVTESYEFHLALQHKHQWVNTMYYIAYISDTTHNYFLKSNRAVSQKTQIEHLYVSC